MNSFILYIILQLDCIRGFFIFFAIITGICSILISIIFIESHGDDKVGKWKSIHIVIYSFISFSLLTAITPTTSNAAIFLGVPKALEVYQTEVSPEIKELYTLLKNKLVSEITSTRKEEKK